MRHTLLVTGLISMGQDSLLESEIPWILRQLSVGLWHHHMKLIDEKFHHDFTF